MNGFLPNLAGPDGALIFLVVLLLFGAKKLPELLKEKSEPTEEAERNLRKCDAIAVILMFLIVALFVVAVLQGY
jgi:Na+/H+ antiporter NhaD/arsenite permease-like protein